MDIPLDTTLSTERLLLRAVDFPDVDLVWEASRFEGFNDGMVWDTPEQREHIVEVTQRNIDEWRTGRQYVFTICAADPARAIGRVGLRREGPPGVWNIGFWIHPEHWGNGFAPEAARAALAFAFDSLGAKRVVTAHAIWNTRSEGVIRRLGFEFLRENPDGFRKDGKPVAEFEYELRRALAPND